MISQDISDKCDLTAVNTDLTSNILSNFWRKFKPAQDIEVVFFFTDIK